MDQKPNYYAIIPAEVRYDKDLRAGAKIFYGEITALCSKYGICTASNSYFAELYNMTSSGISRWVTQLKNKGYISVEYEKEGREIKNRIIKLNLFYTTNPVVEEVLTNINRVLTKTQGGYLQKDNRGIDKNAKRIIQDNNNTSINNNICANSLEIEKRFNEFWNQYPRKVNKSKCEEWYKKNKVSEELQNDIMFGLTMTSSRDRWNDIEKEYIPHPLTFLNQKRWEDFKS